MKTNNIQGQILSGTTFTTIDDVLGSQEASVRKDRGGLVMFPYSTPGFIVLETEKREVRQRDLFQETTSFCPLSIPSFHIQLNQTGGLNENKGNSKIRK